MRPDSLGKRLTRPKRLNVRGKTSVESLMTKLLPNPGTPSWRASHSTYSRCSDMMLVKSPNGVSYMEHRDFIWWNESFRHRKHFCQLGFSLVSKLTLFGENVSIAIHTKNGFVRQKCNFDIWSNMKSLRENKDKQDVSIVHWYHNTKLCMQFGCKKWTQLWTIVHIRCC